jgi:hypothetical protein
MSKSIVFIQVHGRPGIIESELSAAATVGELFDVLAASGVTVVGDTFVFVDEAEEHLSGERHHAISGMKHGSRVHVTHCRRIKTTVHFLNKTTEREFAPGARVRAVKEWAVRTFGLSPKDAAEHVLQVCKSTKRPPSDTPLNELLHEEECSLCFDLVPEKRVEG